MRLMLRASTMKREHIAVASALIRTIPNSISNPYGQYGNPYSPDSIKNPYGAGNPYSTSSPYNPYGQGLEIYGD